MRHDCCPACGAAVSFYRRDFGWAIDEAGAICLCYHCQFDLRDAPQAPVAIYDDEVFQLYVEMLRALDGAVSDGGRFDLKFHAVLHQLCKVMLSAQNHDQLRQYVAKMLGVATAPAVYGRMSLEHRRVFDRYQTVFFALWLLAGCTGRKNLRRLAGQSEGFVAHRPYSLCRKRAQRKVEGRAAFGASLSNAMLGLDLLCNIAPKPRLMVRQHHAQQA
jgi:hypothetical protein